MEVGESRRAITAETGRLKELARMVFLDVEASTKFRGVKFEGEQREGLNIGIVRLIVFLF